ncbi:hypothetical protein GQ53DRAFT_829406 [Thozetella sp. PMI_491]|nr:hypothetical protein GQ53DRAFT_829406 [Thozetella sp. PMI_491]
MPEPSRPTWERLKDNPIHPWRSFDGFSTVEWEAVDSRVKQWYDDWCKTHESLGEWPLFAFGPRPNIRELSNIGTQALDDELRRCYHELKKTKHSDTFVKLIQYIDIANNHLDRSQMVVLGNLDNLTQYLKNRANKDVATYVAFYLHLSRIGRAGEPGTPQYLNDMERMLLYSACQSSDHGDSDEAPDTLNDPSSDHFAMAVSAGHKLLNVPLTLEALCFGTFENLCKVGSRDECTNWKPNKTLVRLHEQLSRYLEDSYFEGYGKLSDLPSESDELFLGYPEPQKEAKTSTKPRFGYKKLATVADDDDSPVYAISVWGVVRQKTDEEQDRKRATKARKNLKTRMKAKARKQRDCLNNSIASDEKVLETESMDGTQPQALKTHQYSPVQSTSHEDLDDPAQFEPTLDEGPSSVTDSLFIGENSSQAELSDEANNNSAIASPAKVGTIQRIADSDDQTHNAPALLARKENDVLTIASQDAARGTAITNLTSCDEPVKETAGHNLDNHKKGPVQDPHPSDKDGAQENKTNFIPNMSQQPETDNLEPSSKGRELIDKKAKKSKRQRRRQRKKVLEESMGKKEDQEALQKMDKEEDEMKPQQEDKLQQEDKPQKENKPQKEARPKKEDKPNKEAKSLKESDFKKSAPASATAAPNDSHLQAEVTRLMAENKVLRASNESLEQRLYEEQARLETQKEKMKQQNAIAEALKARISDLEKELEEAKNAAATKDSDDQANNDTDTEADNAVDLQGPAALAYLGSELVIRGFASVLGDVLIEETDEGWWVGHPSISENSFWVAAPSREDLM